MTTGVMMSLGGGGKNEVFLIGVFFEWWDKLSVRREVKRKAKAVAKGS